MYVHVYMHINVCMYMYHRHTHTHISFTYPASVVLHASAGLWRLNMGQLYGDFVACFCRVCLCLYGPCTVLSQWDMRCSRCFDENQGLGIHHRHSTVVVAATRGQWLGRIFSDQATVVVRAYMLLTCCRWARKGRGKRQDVGNLCTPN